MSEANGDTRIADDDERRAEVRPTQALHALLDALLVNAFDAIVTVDREGTICYTSPGASLLLGYDAVGMVGTSIFSYLRDDDVTANADLFARRLGYDGPDLDHEVLVAHATGRLIAVRVAATMLPDQRLGVVALTLRADEGEISREGSLRRQLVIEEFCNRLSAEFMRATSPDEIPELIQRSMQDVALLVGAEVASLHVERPERGVLERIARWTRSPSAPAVGVDQVEIGRHRDIVETALTESYLADDLNDPVHARMATLASGSGAASILSSPFTAGDLRGVLTLGRLEPGRAWMDSDAQLSRGVALVYGRALDMARVKRLLTLTYSRGPIAFSIRNVEGTLVDCNHQYLELYGLTRAEAETVRLTELIGEADARYFMNAAGSLAAGEIAHLRRDVRIRRTVPPKWLRCSVVRLDAGDSNEPLYLAAMEDITEIYEQREELKWAAGHDSLTGVANRFAMLERIDQLAHETGRMPHVLLTDLDRFKLINDSLGHLEGDKVLVEVGQRIVEAVGEFGLVARLGGDEFAIVVSDMTRAQVRDLAERVRRSLGRPLGVGVGQTTQTISIGVAIGDDCGDATELLVRADRAMYAAKALGRNRFVVFDASMRDEGLLKVEVERELRYAIDHDQLEVFYQPECALDDRRVLGVEALVRWRHPERGLLLAGAFIDVAEQSGMIEDIGRFALRQACRQFAQIAAAVDDGSSVLRVNISAREFSRPELPDLVRQALADAGLGANRLCLEVTETTLMDTPDVVLETFARLREIGVEFAIDDFGTGYSSLSYLKRFPVDALKIDRSFVADIDTDNDSRAIVESIVGLGRALSLAVVAEGIETERQIEILRSLGCRRGQGRLFAAAMPSDQLIEFLKRS